MRSDKNTALKLRLQGRSYTEIQRALGIPKSTLSGWLANLVLSPAAREQIVRRARKKSIAALIKRNKNQTRLARLRAADIRTKAMSEVEPLSKKDVFLFGIALYWAEGYKRPQWRNGREVTYHVVSLTNADPLLVKMFLRFLRECCGVPEKKLKANLRIFPHQNEAVLQRFWQKETGILVQNFMKTYTGISKASMRKRPYNRLPYGVIQVTVADTQLFHRIMGYLEGIKRFV